MTDDRLELTDDRALARAMRLDYALGLFKILYGLFLLAPAESMAGPSFELLKEWASEAQWGAMILGVGAVQLMAGRMEDGDGWRPLARVVTNYLSGVMWGVIAMSFAHANPWSTGFANYAAIALAHGYCAVRAAREAAHNAMARHGG